MTELINIRKRNIGGDSPCYIIAEMSANHAGDFKRAIEIIHAASDAGADCVKVQTYTADTLTLPCSNDYFQITDGMWKGETLHSLYKKAYTPWEWHRELKLEAEKRGMDFLSTPFDKTAVDFLEELDVGFYKIASFELVDIPLLNYVALKGKPVILSTGMASLGEIREAVSALRTCGNEQICLLKCSSAYPAVSEEMNLKTIEDMQRVFKVPVGLSDHSLGSTAAIAAVALGAKVIEKHFCISRKIETPDSSFSLEYNEFKEMAKNIRYTEKALGKVNYGMTVSEKTNRQFRKSIFAIRDIVKGEILNEENVRIIRPGYGLEPKYYNNVIGKSATTDIPKGSPLSWDLMDCGGGCSTGETDEHTPGTAQPALIADNGRLVPRTELTTHSAVTGGHILATDRLTLREIAGMDEEDIVRWRNQKDVSDYLFSRRGPTLSEHREWYRQYIGSSARLEFIIIRNTDCKKLGIVGLGNIDPPNFKAELGILIGETDERGKGYGYEACFACIRYGFDILDLNKIYLKVFSTNRNAVKLYKKLGFKREGLLREEFVKSGTFLDVIHMSVIKSNLAGNGG